MNDTADDYLILIQPNSPAASNEQCGEFYGGSSPDTSLIVFETAESDGCSMSIEDEEMHEDNTCNRSDGSELGYESPDTSLVIFEAEQPPARHSTPDPKRRRVTMPEPDLQQQQSEISILIQSPCCTRRCLAQLSVIEIEETRKQFKERNITEQNQFLLDSFQIMTTKEEKISGRTFTNHMIVGKHVCRNAFIRLLGISDKRYRRISEQFSHGVTKSKRKPVFRDESDKVSTSKAWMTRYFRQIGDHMPHLNQIHLPHFLTKKAVYSRMKDDLQREGIPEFEVLSQSHFYSIWAKCFKNVVIPEVQISL